MGFPHPTFCQTNPINPIGFHSLKSKTSKEKSNDHCNNKSQEMFFFFKKEVVVNQYRLLTVRINIDQVSGHSNAATTNVDFVISLPRMMEIKCYTTSALEKWVRFENVRTPN